MSDPNVIAVIASVSGIALIWIGWFKHLWPKIQKGWDKLLGIFQTLGGRDPIVDKVTGKEVSPAVPPLGEHLASINENVAELIKVVRSNQDAHRRLDNHDAHLADHDSTLAALIGGSYERGAEKVLKAAEKIDSEVVDEQ